MSVLEFIVQMTSALAWPLVSGGAIILLRKQIKSAATSLVERIGEIARLQFPGGSIDFREVEALAATTEELVEDIPTRTITRPPPEDHVLPPTETGDQRFDRYRQLAKVDPRSAILVPFADVEGIVREEFERLYPHERKGLPFNRVVDILIRDRIFSSGVKSSLQQLASIRNRVAHENYSVDSETAELYVQSVEDVWMYVVLMKVFDKIPDQ